MRITTALLAVITVALAVHSAAASSSDGTMDSIIWGEGYHVHAADRPGFQRWKVRRLVNVEIVDGKPQGTFSEPSAALADEKKEFGASRRTRWFGSSK